jgi:hypothetical protein
MCVKVENINKTLAPINPGAQNLTIPAEHINTIIQNAPQCLSNTAF